MGTKGEVTEPPDDTAGGPNTKGRVTDMLRKVSPGSQSPRKSLGSLGQTRVPSIAAAIKEWRQRHRLEFNIKGWDALPRRWEPHWLTYLLDSSHHDVLDRLLQRHYLTNLLCWAATQ